MVEERLRHVRAFLGRRIGLTGPQYLLLITVAYLQGAGGIAVRLLAKNLRVTSAFITGESRRLIERGLLVKRPNPHDSRSTLLSVTPLGRRRIEELVPLVRAVNDRFFGHLGRISFRHAMRFLEHLLDGSRDALAYIGSLEGQDAQRPAVRRAKSRVSIPEG
ncbi:MAG: MarR family winged helix-turn-helix transcriptional regulator [Betaproteobacteria bacterium]